MINSVDFPIKIQLMELKSPVMVYWIVIELWCSNITNQRSVSSECFTCRLHHLEDFSELWFRHCCTCICCVYDLLNMNLRTMWTSPWLNVVNMSQIHIILFRIPDESGWARLLTTSRYSLFCKSTLLTVRYFSENGSVWWQWNFSKQLCPPGYFPRISALLLISSRAVTKFRTIFNFNRTQHHRWWLMPC